jgi:hypothetical protein
MSYMILVCFYLFLCLKKIISKNSEVVTYYFYLKMGLLGKTLKGRTAREGGLPPKKNIKVRQIAKTQ